MRIRFATVLVALVFMMGARTAIHAGPNIIYVNSAVVGGTGDGSSWANAAPDLGFVMFNHTEPAEFWVATGTYDPFTNAIGPSVRNGAFRIRAGQAIYGGFTGTETQRDERNPIFHPVTLTGERGPAPGVIDNYRNVVRFVTLGAETGVLDGVTVTRGFDDSGTPSAGGIVVEGGNVTISGVTVRENYGAHGGGIHVMGGDVTIEFSGIYQNGERGVGATIYEAGLGVTGGTLSAKRLVLSGDPTLVDGTIADLSGGNTALDDLSFDNAAVGLRLTGGVHDLRQVSFGKLGFGLSTVNASVAVEGAYFEENGTPFQMEGGALDITNATFVKNGGFVVDRTMTVRNSTFIDNGTATSTATTTIIHNSIIWPPTGIPAAPTTPVALVNGLWDGTCGGPVTCDHIANQDPLLLPLANINSRLPAYPLKFGSPAIDAANPAQCPAGDQRLEDRPIDGDGDGTAVCDLGAYELRPPRIQFVLASSSFTEGGTQGIPNSFGIDVEIVDPVFEQAQIQYAVTGGTADSRDFTLASGTLTFEPSGARSLGVSLVVHDDFLVEPTETVVIALSNPRQASIGAPGTHTLRIFDDEPRRKCAGVAATMVGSAGADVIIGTDARDVIVARGGNDRVRAGGGRDLVCGGADNDRLRGAAGDDVILGNGGVDIAFGGAGNDALEGGGGDDALRGGAGRDRLEGGRGTDDLRGQIGGDRLAGGPGAGDVCDGGAGTDSLLPGAGCETVSGIP